MEEKSAYFLSDAHLGVNPPGAISFREEKLIQFLKSIGGEASHIVFLGDLFEFWYEYRYYVSSEHISLFRVLGDLSEAGVSIHLLLGNHDFAFEEFFPKALGVKVSRHLLFEVQGKKIYCTHGDGLASSDKGYRALRRVLDFPLNRKLFRCLHPDWGMGLAKFVGKKSRKWGEQKEIRLEEYIDRGNKLLNEKGADIFLHGHHHLKGIWRQENGKLIASPGQWLFSLNFLKLSRGLLSLHSADEILK